MFWKNTFLAITQEQKGRHFELNLETGNVFKASMFRQQKTKNTLNTPFLLNCFFIKVLTTYIIWVWTDMDVNCKVVILVLSYFILNVQQLVTVLIPPKTRKNNLRDFSKFNFSQFESFTCPLSVKDKLEPVGWEFWTVFGNVFLLFLCVPSQGEINWRRM